MFREDVMYKDILSQQDKKVEVEMKAANHDPIPKHVEQMVDSQGTASDSPGPSVA